MMKGRRTDKRHGISRRRFLQTVGAVGGAAAFGGVAPAFIHAQQEPIKIGHIAPQTGFLAGLGK
ncbi:MAG TPA: twin-arginine translocation signal domain-containing protein, partial [Candidatus Sulfotelmatobacter sp.]|nr:twin-arginine translocation signal domain-containing protein [Candidatus Sulfotelmatobacter sp.]